MESPPPAASAPPLVHAMRLAGRDVLGVLHRVSSNDLATLPPGESRTTLFCDYRGRLLHRAVVAHEPGGDVWLLSDSPSERLAAFVDSRVFREDVRIVEPGATVPAALAPLALAAFGADERARIGAGLPRFGHEIDEAFNPYEAGVAHEVHLAKGCYTGQEALQRLMTYGSVRRERVRFEGRGAAPAPQDVLADDEAVGRLTSATADGQGWVALAIVRITALEAGAALHLADGTPLDAAVRLSATSPLGRA